MSKYTIAALVVAAIALLSVGTQAAQAAEEPITVQVHGYMLNRGYLAQGANPQFRNERISVSTIAGLPQNANAYVEVYYHPWATASGLYLESAYYDRPIGSGRIRVGKGRRIVFGITPAYPNRRTTNYGIVSEAFTQDRVQGLQYTVQQGVLDVGAGIFTSNRLGIRSIGEIPGDAIHNAGHSVAHLAFRDPLSGSGVPNARLSNKLEATARIGVKLPMGLKAGISGLMGALDAEDVANLTTSAAGNVLTPGASASLLPAGVTSKKKNVWGLDASYKDSQSGLVAQGEFYDATVSRLGYNAWNGLVGWEGKEGWRAYARYSEQNMDIAPTANPLSWDTKQLSLSFVQPISKGVWLQYEYENNDEKPNVGPKVKNDVFFVELFSGF